MIKATTWIVDEAETEESAAEVCHLNTATTWLCYARLKDELGDIVVRGLCYERFKDEPGNLVLCS